MEKKNMPGASQAPKSLATTKDTTMAIETRAGVLKDAESEIPKPEEFAAYYVINDDATGKIDL